LLHPHPLPRQLLQRRKANANAYSYSYSHAYTYGYSYAYAYTHSDSHTTPTPTATHTPTATPNCHSNSYAYTDSYTYTDANATNGTSGVFQRETALGGGWYYLQFANRHAFGYYSYLSDQNFIYHIDLGFEYWFDAIDDTAASFFYDFLSNHFFYTSPSFPFPVSLRL